VFLVRPPVPSRPGPVFEDLIMEQTVNTKTGTSDQHPQHASYQYLGDRDTSSREQSDHLPVEHMPTVERAHLVPSSARSLGDYNKTDEVLIRDTIVQHISEDEKSTTSEEVVFEEWSEEFRCRRTEEYDHNTNRLLRTTIDETSNRVKSDVIKEEYKEKNERIKGHKSYDVVKEVYRRVPANTIDTSKSTVVAIERPQSHHYEEIPHPTTSPTGQSVIGEYFLFHISIIRFFSFRTTTS
jgi:hypothetical protein